MGPPVHVSISIGRLSLRKKQPCSFYGEEEEGAYVRICTYVHQGRESTEFTISSSSELFCLKEVGEGLFFFICLTCDIRFKRISRVVEEGGGLDRERGKRRNSDTVLLLPPN